MNPKLLHELSRLYEAEARAAKSPQEKIRLHAIAHQVRVRARSALNYLHELRGRWPITAQKETPRNR